MSYSFYRTLTIDHTKCGSGNSTDFPVLFSGTYAYLKTAGNGGDIQNTASVGGYTVPADLVFTSDIAGTSLLKWEVEFYDATTGVIVAWVKVPTVSASVDTVIYMFYKDASVTTWQGDVNGTWNSNFKRVYHFPDGTTLSATDSTSGAHNGTINSGVAGAGQIDGAYFNNGANPSITASDVGLPTGTSDRTISLWFKGLGNADGAMIDYGTVAIHQFQRFYTPNPHTLTANGAAGDDLVFDNVSNFNATLWYHIAYTLGGTTTARIYINGAQVATGSVAWNTLLKGTIWVGSTDPSLANLTSSGTIDEVHISDVERSADWLLSEYNNQLDPSTFYAVGSAVSVGGGGASRFGAESIVLGNAATLRIG